MKMRGNGLTSNEKRIKTTLFVNHGITIDRTVKLWASGRKSLNEYRKPIDQCLSNEFWKGQLDSELTQLDALSLQLTSIEKKLDEIGKQDPRVVRVMTMDGVGSRTAEALVAAIDDPHRFDNARQVSSYVGLVPKQYQSGETDRNGRISKRGPGLVRTRPMASYDASSALNCARIYETTRPIPDGP